MVFRKSLFPGVCPLFILFSGLQVLDYVSTKLALATGLAEEKNDFLVSFSDATSAPIGVSILMSKALIIALMGWAIMRSRDDFLDRALLTGACTYYAMVCFLNLYWAFTLI